MTDVMQVNNANFDFFVQELSAGGESIQIQTFPILKKDINKATRQALLYLYVHGGQQNEKLPMLSFANAGLKGTLLLQRYRLKYIEKNEANNVVITGQSNEFKSTTSNAKKQEFVEMRFYDNNGQIIKDKNLYLPNYDIMVKKHEQLGLLYADNTAVQLVLYFLIEPQDIALNEAAEIKEYFSTERIIKVICDGDSYMVAKKVSDFFLTKENYNNAKNIGLNPMSLHKVNIQALFMEKIIDGKKVYYAKYDFTTDKQIQNVDKIKIENLNQAAMMIATNISNRRASTPIMKVISNEEENELLCYGFYKAEDVCKTCAKISACKVASDIKDAY